MRPGDGIFTTMVGALAVSLMPAACVSEIRLPVQNPIVALAAANVLAWPQANVAFRADPRWRGGDAAYSVDLGGRVLWLFGDTFVAAGAGAGRAGAHFVRNTVAIQEGYDPSKGRLTFSHGGTTAKPDSFFDAGRADQWLWPGPGVRIGKTLLLFFSTLRHVTGGLGFETTGTVAWRIDNPDDPVDAWRHRVLPLPANDRGVALGMGSLVVDKQQLLAFSPVEPGNHAVHLARWNLDAVSRGDLSHPSWSQGPVFTGGQTEFSVHRSAKGYSAIQTVGFGGATIAMRTAPAPEGPWTEPVTCYRPPEASQKGILIYSAKAHPYLAGPGLVVTYCTNHLDFPTVIANDSLYYPQFIRLSASER